MCLQKTHGPCSCYLIGQKNNFILLIWSIYVELNLKEKDIGYRGKGSGKI